MSEEDKEIHLRVPGPTPLPPVVREALACQMINHRGPAYAALQAEVLGHLRHFFVTDSDVLLFTASGTGGLEAALVNTLSPGDRVVAVTMGSFGDRFAAMADAFGAHVTRVETPWGEAARPDALTAALADAPGTRAVLLTANETSTGVINDVAALAAAARAAPGDPLLIVDAISALGAVDLPMDALGIDVVITGSQKAWMAPPGLTMLGVSARAWAAHGRATMPRFYWDFSRQRAAQEKGMDAFTPAVSTVRALRAGLRLMREEGREAIIARHARIAAQTQRGLEALGMRLYAEAGHRSPTVTAVVPPAGIAVGALIRDLRERHGVVVAGGQDRLAGQIIRIGHMGWVEEEDIAATLAAIEDSLRRPRAETS